MKLEIIQEKPTYEEFLKAKMAVAVHDGIEVELSEINPLLKGFQAVTVQWALAGGSRAIFSSFGLGKSMTQLEIIRLALEKNRLRRGLIIAPLGVRLEFMRDWQTLKTGNSPAVSDDQRVTLWNWHWNRGREYGDLQFIQRTKEVSGDGIFLTNYESIRDGRLDPTLFDVVTLDEASCLRSFGSKTFGEAVFGPLQKVRYRFVATATPSPNEYLELIAYAHFLGVMDMGEAKTRFFRRNSEKADNLTLHPHKEQEFWLWCSTWALFLQKPSDLGFSDEGYELPPLEIHWHEIPTNYETRVSVQKNGQIRLLKDSSMSAPEAARERRDTLDGRIAKVLELRSLDPQAHRVLWHDYEDEREALQDAIPSVTSVFGKQDLEDREAAINAFSIGELQELSTKPIIAGSGCNLQRHCHWAIYLGIGFKFNDFIQSIHRLLRFGQTQPVRIDLIYTEAERGVRATLERKWTQHNRLVDNMTRIIREYGLSYASVEHLLSRSIGVEREEATGKNWKLVHNDSVLETRGIPDASIGLIHTSIPFSTQYEYTPSYNDFGHTETENHFYEQMDYLTPELFRVLKPGRVLAVHVKDRVTPGAMTGLGFQSITPFHAKAITHYQAHGFVYNGMKTIVTDVVRENAQTYRLGWSEMCKDSSRMGCGLPEYLLLFRKPPTDSSDGYADERVKKSKDDYSRARWQFDAHGFMRSSGNRLLMPDDLRGLPMNKIFRAFKAHSKSTVYNFEHDVQLAEYLDSEGMLPPGFMLLQPQSNHPDVWADIVRMRSLNTAQASKGRDKHICPLPFDIVNRTIVEFSEPGDIVYDPFAGLGTVAYCAVKLGRIGWGCELNGGYWADSVWHAKNIALGDNAPTLFDLEEGIEEVAHAV